MLTELAQYESLFGPLRLFRFISFRSAGGAATALIIGMLIAPWLIARLRALKAGQSFRSRQEIGALADLHAGKRGTPTMGGLIIYCSVVISALLWAQLNVYVVTALVVYTGMTLIGFADDYLKVVQKSSRGLPGRYKLLGQTILTVITMLILLNHPASAEHLNQLWVPFLKEPLITAMPLWFMFVLFFLVLAGSSNAINLTDGVDGLAIGCTITVAMVYGLMAYASGHAIYAQYLYLPFQQGTGELTVLCAILCAASLAFLWHNAHPALVFMGDTGSLALGGLVGVISLMVLQPITLILVGGVFVMEATSVILQVGSFKLTRKRIFKMAPIHHHFELKGWAETQVVVRFWILSLLFAIAGLATLKIR